MSVLTLPRPPAAAAAARADAPPASAPAWATPAGRLLPPAPLAVPGRLDLALSSAWGALAVRLPLRRAALRRRAAAVQARAEAVAALDDAALRTAALTLRPELARRPLPPAVQVQVLALVREAARRSLGLWAHAEQIMGAAALLEGDAVEMATGEGKTLTAGLAAACAALGGRPVHVVTVNDYLAERDAGFLRPLLASFGLRVDHTAAGQDAARRRAVYACHVVYASNKDLAFDALRDELRRTRASPRRDRLDQLLDPAAGAGPLLPDLAFAIVDEADSVLIDEARVPLIIATERDTLPPELFAQALAGVAGLQAGQHFLLDAAAGSVDWTEAGREALRAATAALPGLWRSERAREQLGRQALTALHLFQRDRDYLVRDGQVHIVDESTGRVLGDRHWERGQHQMVEVKEGLPPSPSREPLARSTYQRFFTRYETLAGMSGTLREVAGELWAVYGLRVVALPTHRPVRRHMLPLALHAGESTRCAALAARCRALQAAGRPVLIGTRSIRMSETVQQALAAAGLAATVLNAKQDRFEAEVVAAAGQPGRITVATNMAGRGTDIVLDAAVRAAGGLHVVLTELHETTRVDRQLFGRCARQGDPGSAEVLACLEDDLFSRHAPRLQATLRRLARSDGRPLPRALAAGLAARAQARAGRAQAGQRLRVLREDRRLEQLMAFAGRKEQG